MAQKRLGEYREMIERSMLVIGWATVAAVALVFVLPTTRLVYQPESVEIVGDQVTMYRSFPGDAWGLPRPRISYIETVRPMTQTTNGGHPCEFSGGPRRYDRTDEVGRWQIDWAADCISDPIGYVWSAEWTWHIGHVELGPVDISERVLSNPCQYKISQNGVIHGADSPYWSQTSPSDCYPTRSAAEAALHLGAGTD